MGYSCTQYAKFAIITLGLLGVCGCSNGIKFINSATNLPVPPTLQARTLWDDPSIAQYKPEVLIGYVLEKSTPTDNWKRKKQIIPATVSTIPEVIKDGQFYHSIVDSSIAVNGGVTIPIVSAAAKLSVDQRMELTIEDAALLLVPDNVIPWDDLVAYNTQNPPSTGVSRSWVQAVMLTKMYYSIAQKTNSDSTVSGAAYAADSKTFNQNTGLQRQPYITLLLVDLDDIQKKQASRNLTGKPSYRTIVIPKGGIE